MLMQVNAEGLCSLSSGAQRTRISGYPATSAATRPLQRGITEDPRRFAPRINCKREVKEAGKGGFSIFGKR